MVSQIGDRKRSSSVLGHTNQVFIEICGEKNKNLHQNYFRFTNVIKLTISIFNFALLSENTSP